jgi:hypothetical protein
MSTAGRLAIRRAASFMKGIARVVGRTRAICGCMVIGRGIGRIPMNAWRNSIQHAISSGRRRLMGIMDFRKGQRFPFLNVLEELDRARRMVFGSQRRCCFISGRPTPTRIKVPKVGADFPVLDQPTFVALKRRYPTSLFAGSILEANSCERCRNSWWREQSCRGLRHSKHIGDIGVVIDGGQRKWRFELRYF